jgi:peptidoglycan/xylan/chitin deacetylase (PgdA/CDA1 family)
MFGPSVWHGPRSRRAIALTFDDGPSESTPELLEILAKFRVPATFFVCGLHVRRLPGVARALVAAGHELGNHTDTHARLWLRSTAFLREEIGRAQESIAEVTGITPRLFRAPYGVRWPGLRKVQMDHRLLGVMWTVLARDWALPAPRVAQRVIAGAGNGGILCLHDGRERQTNPDIRATLDAVREAVPRIMDAGYEFRTVTNLIG